MTQDQTTRAGETIGYARTSTIDQVAGLEAQERDLRQAGVTRLFSEQVSSVAARRPQLDAALSYVRPGDTFVVTKLCRLARSIKDFIYLVEELASKGVTLKILGMGLDTSTPTGKLILNMLAAIAQFEREVMRERQREGIAKAKREGKYLGKAPLDPKKAARVIALHQSGNKVSEIVRSTGVSRAKCYKIVAKLKEPA